jgi:hypothetical protein
MILGQYSSPKLKSFLSKHHSILMPPKGTVRGGKVAHCSACNRPSYSAHVKLTNAITSHLFEDGSQAKHVAETQASSLASPEHLDAAQG